jgi:hypothetical protein
MASVTLSGSPHENSCRKWASFYPTISVMIQMPSPLAEVQQGIIAAITLAPVEGSTTDALQEFVIQNIDELCAAGIDYHELANSNHSVLFNPSKITSSQIDAAQKAGKLFEVAPLMTELRVTASTNISEQTQLLLFEILRSQECEKPQTSAHSPLPRSKKLEVVKAFLRDSSSKFAK